MNEFFSGRKRPTDIDLVKKMTDLEKSYFSVADLEKILGIKKNSLYVTLNRLVKNGVLIRLKKNIYSLFTKVIDYEKIGSEIYFPSYLSFEQALSQYSILSQIPFTETFATPRLTKKIEINGMTIEYSHLPKSLFFGYVLSDGKYIAEPEKALLDTLYMVSRGKRSLTIEELDLKNIDRKKLDEYAKKFPSYIKPLVKEVEKYIGSTAVTLEGHERMFWNKGTNPIKKSNNF